MIRSPLRRASTVILLRDGDEGIEVLLLQRHRRSPFLPDAWVFPGGRLDDTDALESDRVIGDVRVPMMDAAACRAYAVAGIRETYEESGIWIGDDSLGADARSALAERPEAFEDWMRANDVHVNMSLLRPWTRWVTPDSEPRRYDTVFFVARFERDWSPAQHDATETVDSGWFSPHTVIAQTIRSFPLAPPTWWVLVELSRYATVDEVMTSTARHCLPVQPILSFGEDGMDVVLPGHPLHPDGPLEGHPVCIEMREGGWCVAG